MITYKTRLELIQSMPANGIGCEVGVYQGGFSDEILHTHVGVLYLVDCWKHQATGYEIDSCNQPDSAQKHIFNGVLDRFQREIKTGRVVIWRGLSVEVAERFPTVLDWVYIDGNHSYDAVLADLRAWERVVTPGGAIMGHDFTHNQMAKDLNFGVIEAVTDFCKESDWKLSALTDEDCASFCLKQ